MRRGVHISTRELLMIDSIRKTVATVLDWRVSMTGLPAELVSQHMDVTHLDMLTDADTESDILCVLETAIDEAETAAIAALGELYDHGAMTAEERVKNG